MANKIAIVLLSGGMDSALCAKIAKDSGFEIAALHLNYRQRTEKKELEAFHKLCDAYGARFRLVVDIEYLKQIGSSSLTDYKIQVEKANLDSKEIPSSLVPFRNGNLIAIAASWAEAINAEAIFIGAVQADSSGYPDCRKGFIEAIEKAINLGTKPETNIKIYTPIIDFRKSDIVKKALEINVPLELTWSCYKSEDYACGECDSCALRLRGFKEAGAKDPIPYENKKKECSNCAYWTNFISITEVYKDMQNQIKKVCSLTNGITGEWHSCSKHQQRGRYE